MKKIIKFIILGTIAMQSLPSFADEIMQPSIFGLSVGMSKESVESFQDGKIFKCVSLQGLTSCFYMPYSKIMGGGGVFELGSLSPSMITVSMGSDNKVESVDVLTANKDYSTVKEALITKYGSPTKTEIMTAQNKMGAVYKYEVLRFLRPDWEIALFEFGNNPDETRVRLQTTAFKEANQRIKEERKKATIDDF